VICGYCRESGIKEEENFVQLDCVHEMSCTEYEPYKERLDREVVQGRKFKNKCNKCGRKWVGTLRYEGVCKICHAERGKKKEIPKKKEKRVLR